MTIIVKTVRCHIPTTLTFFIPAWVSLGWLSVWDPLLKATVVNISQLKWSWPTLKTRTKLETSSQVTSLSSIDLTAATQSQGLMKSKYFQLGSVIFRRECLARTIGPINASNWFNKILRAWEETPMRISSSQVDCPNNKHKGLTAFKTYTWSKSAQSLQRKAKNSSKSATTTASLNHRDWLGQGTIRLELMNSRASN